MINEIQSDVNQKIAKELSKMKQLSGEARTNPFQADIELNLLARNRSKIMNEMTYPGQVKVTVIRETRAISYAK